MVRKYMAVKFRTKVYMKKFIQFWRQDFINKFIVIISMLLAGGMIAFAMMIFNMPYGKNPREALSYVFSFIPTVDPAARITATPNWTPTALPFNLQPTISKGVDGIPTLIPTVEILLESTPEVFTPTPELQVLPTLTQQLAATSAPSATPAAPVALNSDCVPKNPPQTGKVLSILDGNTARIMIEGLTYNVRLIGLAVPANEIYGELARIQSANLIFGREVTLIRDRSDKDDHGRLLRYVLVGDTFVNLVLIEKGLGSALDTPPDSACYQTFKLAEQSAINSQFGMYKATPTP